MKRLLAICLCLSLLCACTTGRESPKAFPIPDETGWVSVGGTLVFALPADADDRIATAATSFCEDLRKLSGGEIVVRVQPCADPAGELRRGSAQFALLTRSGDLDGLNPLGVTSIPFLYESYYNYSMRTNAQDTLHYLTRELSAYGVRPLGAYYQGAQHLLSTFATESNQQFQDRWVALEPDERVSAAFSVLECQLVEAEGVAQRLELLLEGEVDAIEVSLRDLGSIDWEEMPYLNFSLSYHSVTPVWLLADDEWCAQRSSLELAWLEEACARLTNNIDDGYLREEAEQLELLEDHEVPIYEDLTNTRNKVQGNRHGLEERMVPDFGSSSWGLLRIIWDTA